MTDFLDSHENSVLMKFYYIMMSSNSVVSIVIDSCWFFLCNAWHSTDYHQLLLSCAYDRIYGLCKGVIMLFTLPIYFNICRSM